MPSSPAPQPPRPPTIERRFAPRASQLVGVAVLGAIVLSALLGVFGPVHVAVAAQEAPLQLETRYPERFRFKTIDTIDVAVANTGATVLDAVAVRFSRAYVDAFSTVAFTPSVDRVTGEAYEVTLTQVRPGETRRVSVEIQAEAYWRHTGTVEATAADASVRTELATLVLP